MERMSTQKIGISTGTGAGIAVAGTATVYSAPVRINHARAFCLSIKSTVDSGTPDVDLYVEQTHIDPTGLAQGAAGNAADGWNQIEGASKILDITDELWHHLTISPAVLGWVRLKAIGQGTNPASNVLSAFLTQMENLGS